MAKLVAKQKVLAVDFKRPILHGSMATECNVSRSLDWWIGPESNSRNSAVCPTSFEAKNSEILLTWKTRKMYLKNWFRFIQSRDPNFVTLVAFLAALHFFMLGEFISFFLARKLSSFLSVDRFVYVFVYTVFKSQGSVLFKKPEYRMNLKPFLWFHSKHVKSFTRTDTRTGTKFLFSKDLSTSLRYNLYVILTSLYLWQVGGSPHFPNFFSIFLNLRNFIACIA